MNFVNLFGRLGNDPEVRHTPNGFKITTFNLACNFKTNETQWFKVFIYNTQYDKMISFLKKGSSVVVIGELQAPKIYTAASGETKVSLEVKALHLAFNPFAKAENKEPSKSTNEFSDKFADIEDLF